MTRDDIEALLPFLANGTLDGDERVEVEQAVADDPALASELAALKAIRQTMQNEEHYSPGELGLRRLMREVDDAPAHKPVPGPVVRPVIWQIAAALLLAVALGQAFVLTRSTEPGGFELAGTPPAFEITIAETATEAQFRALLLDAGVEIVSGPSALGFYALAPLDGVTEDEARAILSASDLVESLSEAGN